MYRLLKEVEEQAHKIFRIACHDHQNDFIRLYHHDTYPHLEYKGFDYTCRIEKDNAGIAIKFTLLDTASNTTQMMVGFLDDLEIFEQECRQYERELLAKEIERVDKHREVLQKKKERL